jgi:streptomycin 6-kinase
MVTDELVENVKEAWGQAGADWLDRLPAVLAEIEERWSLQVSGPFDLSFNYVAPAICEDGAEVVLKLGVPGDHFRREVEALRIFSGRGSVRLLKSDPLVGVMMLERLKPGAYLGDVSDERRATSIAAGVMRRLWRPAPSEHRFP